VVEDPASDVGAALELDAAAAVVVAASLSSRPQALSARPTTHDTASSRCRRV